MSDFELEAWEWPPGLERRYLMEPFQSDCLGWFGFTRVTLCVIPFRSAEVEAGASADDTEFMVVFRPELWREEARLSWAKSASVVGEPLGVPMLNYTLSTGLRLFPLNRTLFELPLDAPHIEEFLRTELPTLLFLPHHLDSVPYFYLEEGLCFLRDEEGWWNNADISTPFRLPVPLLGQSSATLYRWLCSQMAQPHSEVRFAYEWNRKSFEQMNRALVEFDPQIEQWQRVLKAVVRAEIELHHNSFFWRLVPQSNGQDLTSELWQQHHRIDTEHPSLSKRLWLWSQILQWRCPFRKPQPHTIPLCLWRDYQHTTSIFDTYGSTTTTGHEQLEARLFLREWVQDKATPAEIAFLLPTE